MTRIRRKHEYLEAVVRISDFLRPMDRMRIKHQEFCTSDVIALTVLTELAHEQPEPVHVRAAVRKPHKLLGHVAHRSKHGDAAQPLGIHRSLYRSVRVYKIYREKSDLEKVQERKKKTYLTMSL